MDLKPVKTELVVRCKEAWEYHNLSNSFPEFQDSMRLMIHNSIRAQLRVLDSQITFLRIILEALPRVSQVKVKLMDRTSTIST